MRKFILLACIVLFLVPSAADAKVQSAQLAVDVNGGQWKSVRLKNLPRNALVTVTLRSNGTVTVALMNEIQYRTYPALQRPLFHSTVRDKLSFSVKIPSTAHYYLVFDNRSGSRTVQLDVKVHGASGMDAMLLKKTLPKQKPERIEITLSRLGTELNKLFLFDPFPITARTCGKGGAFSGPDGIVLCREFVNKISATMGSREKATSVILFTLLHEVGHNLLRQWGYPFYDNEEVADEFATVLIILLGQKERLSAMTEFFLSKPTSNEVIAKAFRGDRHPLSIQRARNILQWMKDPGRLRRWQTIFVPHMQTAVLEKLTGTSPALFELPLIERELAIRKHLKM